MSEPLHPSKLGWRSQLRYAILPAMMLGIPLVLGVAVIAVVRIPINRMERNFATVQVGDSLFDVQRKMQGPGFVRWYPETHSCELCDPPIQEEDRETLCHLQLSYGADLLGYDMPALWIICFDASGRVTAKRRVS